MSFFRDNRQHLTGGLCGAWVGVALPTILTNDNDVFRAGIFTLAALTAAVMADILPRISEDNPRVPASLESMGVGAILGLMIAAKAIAVEVHEPLPSEPILYQQGYERELA